MLSAAFLFLAVARPPEIQAVADAALAAPPELAADVLIRLAESSRIADKQWKLELVEQAFQLAGAARHPLRKTPAVPLAYKSDSDAGTLAEALDLGLSTLDLQSRAIKAAVTLDPPHALDMFLRIPMPSVPALTCEDAMKYRVDQYYDLLTEVFASGFSERERKKGKDIAFITPYVSGITSVAQIEPVSRMLGRLKISGADYCSLTNALAGAVGQLSADPRSFSAFANGNLIEPYLELANRCRRHGCSPIPLLHAMRGFLSTHIGGPRCADVNADQLKNTVGLFNRRLEPEVAPITELKYSRLSGTATFMARQPEERLKRLDGSEVEIRQFLSTLDQSDSIGFHERAVIYRKLLDLVPSGGLRQTILSSALELLNSSPVLRGSPPEWLLEFKKFRRVPGSDLETRRSGNATMSLYLDLDRVLTGVDQAVAPAHPEPASIRPR